MHPIASVGVLMGILIGLVIAFALLRFSNTNRRMKTEYDERQQAIRGKGYMLAFYTILTYEVLMIVLSIGEIRLPIEDYVLHFGGVILGCIALGTYCVWQGVYWGLNNNRRRYIVVFAVCGILNAIPVLGLLRGSGITENGKIGFPAINILVLIMMAILAVELIIKEVLDRREKEED